MQPKVKTRQDYQGSQETPQQGGGINRQSGSGSGSVAPQEHQGGRRDDVRAQESRRANQVNARSTHRNGARGH